MIFNEVYGCYYNAVSKMIELAIDGELTEKKMHDIAGELAFEESSLCIVPAIKNEDWQLITKDFETPIINKPVMPLTTLEKRWLKTILFDPRIALFQIPTKELEDVEPLFYPDDIVYFDRYKDGDKYDRPEYIANFYIILQAIREHKKLYIEFINGKGRTRKGEFIPVKIEYSDKEDKFRLLCAGSVDIRTINIGRIERVQRINEHYSAKIRLPQRETRTLEFTIKDSRNVLERAMMQFAHFKKEVERVDDKTYHVNMQYDLDDETDVVIQLLSFGRFIKVIGPEEIKDEIKTRILKQTEILNW